MFQADRLSEFLNFLEQIDEGRAQVPAWPGHAGRFLRQYERGRADILRVLAEHGLQPRTDGAQHGSAVGAIEAHAIAGVRVKSHDYVLGDSGDALCISEQLGGLIRLTLWLNAVAARSALNTLNWHGCFRASGDYRWYAPGRVTTGESTITECRERIDWSSARCLTAVADDLFRPPHAHEYVIDFHLGAPGIKYFRSVCATRAVDGWRALPAFGQSTLLPIVHIAPAASEAMGDTALAKFLMYRQPWSEEWSVVNAIAATPEDIVGHSITWADFQLELGAAFRKSSLVAGVIEALRAAGVSGNRSGISGAKTSRLLLPAARAVHRYLRGII